MLPPVTLANLGATAGGISGASSSRRGDSLTAAKQIRDVLKTIEKYHHTLANLYERVGEREEDERLRWLLGYMARHEDHFQGALRRYEESAAKGVLDSWVQFAEGEALEAALRNYRVDASMSADEVIEAALKFDAALLDLYPQLAEETAAPHVQELFTSLLQMEENKEHLYARNLLSIERE